MNNSIIINQHLKISLDDKQMTLITLRKVLVILTYFHIFLSNFKCCFD